MAASPTCSQMAGCESLNIREAHSTLAGNSLEGDTRHDRRSLAYRPTGRVAPPSESSLIVRTRCALCWQRIQPDETRMWTCADGMLLDICEECNELLLARLISRC